VVHARSHGIRTIPRSNDIAVGTYLRKARGLYILGMQFKSSLDSWIMETLDVISLRLLIRWHPDSHLIHYVQEIVLAYTFMSKFNSISKFMSF
jgi:hypothetical protein